MDMLVKIHDSYRLVVAICDKDLIGKKFEEGERVLEIKPSFYEGEEKTEEEVLRSIEMAAAEDATFNIVGKKAIATALKTNLIKKEGIGEIQGVPFALSLL